MSSPSPTFSLEGLKSGLSLHLSASNSQGGTQGPTLTSGPTPGPGSVPRDPAQALPSLRTKGFTVSPLLGALIGISAALGLLTFSLLLILLCRNKRSSSSPTSSSCQVGQELKELPVPKEAPACPEDEWGPARRHNNVYIVEPTYSCTGCPSYSTVLPRNQARPPSGCSYSSLRPQHRDCSTARHPNTSLPEESALLLPLPPPSSHSSGIGSSGSDLDTSRGAEGEVSDSQRTDMESEV